MIHGRALVYLGSGGKCEIWTHGTLLFFGFQDRCNKPDSANFPCGIPSRTRTYRNWILSPVCLPVSSWGCMALGIGLEPITLWLTARCSTVELPKNKWRMVQDLNLWLFCNNISLAKKLNKPLWQPSVVAGEKTGYLRSLINGNQLIPTTMVATHSGFTLWRMLGSNQRLLLRTLWTVKFLESNQYVEPHSALPLS